MRTEPYKLNGSQGVSPKWRRLLRDNDADSQGRKKSVSAGRKANPDGTNGRSKRKTRPLVKKLPIRGRNSRLHRSDVDTLQEPFAKTYSAGAYLRISCRPVEDILAPVLPMDGVAMLSGEKGVGKTFLAMSIAMSVASGKDLFGWRCSRKRRVFFVEPELTVSTGQARLQMVAESQGLSRMPKNLTIWSAAAQYPNPPPNLAKPSQTEAMVRQCSQYDLLVIDSM